MTGKNKKLNYPILKTIRLTLKQAKAWNPDKIRAFLEDSLPNNIKKEIDYVQQPLHNITFKTELVKKLDKLYKDVIENSNLLKLEAYPKETQSICFEMMKDLFQFLQKQLKQEKDKNIIEVKLE